MNEPSIMSEPTMLMETDADDSAGHLLHFTVTGVQYCIGIEAIERIIPLVALQKVPSCPGYMCGILNLHGLPIPAIDLALLLKLDNPDPYTLDTAIIVCQGEPGMGLIVSEVKGVIPFVADDCYHYSDDNQQQSPILATVFNAEEIVYILSTDWIVGKVAVQLNKTILSDNPEKDMR